jgi:putative ABC transport system permease protein
MKTLRSVMTSMARSPLKSTLTLLTVGLGVGVLIFALSISAAFSRLMKNELEKEGIVVMVANAKTDETTGEMEPVRPAQFDQNVLDVLKSDVGGVEAVSPVGGGMGFDMFSQLVAGKTSYQIRSVVSSSEQYAAVMGLDLISGAFFTAEDVAGGTKKVVISESLAEIFFGSASEAVGKTLRPPTPAAPASSSSSGSSGQSTVARRAFVMPAFTVAGVFKDVSELQRTSYGVGDLIVPYTAMLPPGANIQMARQFSMTTIAMRVKGSGLATVEARVREALSLRYGADVSVAVWEGTPRGESSTLQQARSTVATFSLVVNLLGFVLLVTGSIGILSIMLVEVLGRSRQIAIERALGASKRIIAREYFTRSLLVSAASAVVGIALALALASPLKNLVIPIFNGVRAADLTGSVITPAAVGLSVASALLVGGVFGVFPVLPTLRANISDGMREG